MISGESGTGKELAARAIHYLSHRSTNPFVAVNCASIPENLFENEMFGHKKGAYTDASCYQKGLVEEAEGGTLFLDEIGSISPFVQAKLLRFLQDRHYKVLGGTAVKDSDVRIIAATNEDLSVLIKNKLFREDLYYRLNVVNLFISPLRERTEDIPLLIDHFLDKYEARYQTNTVLSKSTYNKLLSHTWPGNVRELENRIQQLVVMSPFEDDSMFDTVAVPDLDQLSPEASSIVSFNEAKSKLIEEFEINFLTDLMKTYKGNVACAAKKTGKGRTALWNLLSKYNISPHLYA